MPRLKRKLYYLIIPLIIWSCEPEDLFIEVQPVPSQLVVSSQFVPDDLLLITVTRSFSALLTDKAKKLSDDELSELLVGQAMVTVHSENQTVSLSEIGENSGLYLGFIEGAKVNQEFHLEVFDPATLQEIKASTRLLPAVPLDSVSYDKILDGDDTTAIFNYRFTDPDEDNWYVLHIYRFSGLPLVSNDSLLFTFFNDNEEELLIYSQLISNLELNNEIVEKEIEIFDYSGPDTVAFMLTNISEDYFRFLDARQRTGGIIASATNEPINHPTNIEGGYGYFNLHIPDIKLAGDK